MSVTRVYVNRMTTSRTDHTKHEHFVMLVNSAGREMSLWMHHNPQHALYSATEVAMFMGLEVEPLIIDGVQLELDEFDKNTIRFSQED